MTDGTNMEMVGLLSEGSTLRSIDGVRLARKLDRETFLSEAVRLAFIRVEAVYHVLRHALAVVSFTHLRRIYLRHISLGELDGHRARFHAPCRCWSAKLRSHEL